MFTNIQGIEALADVAGEILDESVSVYELVTKLSKDESVQFMGAAAAAKKAGQEEFEFGGKKFPVTMAQKVADKINDMKTHDEDEDEPEDINELLSALGVYETRKADEQDGFEKDAEGAVIDAGDEETIEKIAGKPEIKDGEEEEAEDPKEVKEAKLDPVGQEDDDVDNDGDTDDTDEYLKKRRDAIGKAMKKEEIDDEEDGIKGTKDPDKDVKEGFSDEEVRALCHSKDHDCATIIEHPEFGLGKPVHGSHAIPDDNGFVEWYDVEFKHGIEEKVYAKDVKIVENESHMKDDKDTLDDTAMKILSQYNKQFGMKEEEEEDGIEGAAKPDKDVEVKTSKQGGQDTKGDAKTAKTSSDEEDGIQGSKPISKEAFEANWKETTKLSEVNQQISKAIKLKEGKMKELHGHIEDGKSAEEIIKAMKLKNTPDMKKFIQGLMK
jgi:hypothetical protein